MSEKKNIDFGGIRLENIIVRILTSWLIVQSIYLVGFVGDKLSKEDTLATNFVIIVALTCVLFVLITVVNRIFSSERIYKFYLYKENCSVIDYALLLFIVPFFSIITVFDTTSIYLALITTGISVWLVWFITGKFKKFFLDIKISSKGIKIVIIAFAIIMVMYVGALLLLRYFLFRTATFDFGIFAQMFNSMKESFLPYTTCERNRWLSHFDVHMSPIFYLILPIYYVFPYAQTLIVVQLLVIISGVIPLYLICKHKKLPNIVNMCLCLVYLTYPAIYGGLFYDFHENKFLVTLILWLLYFIEKNKKIGITIFTILTLMVKEDAAIYTACIGLFLMLYKGNHRELTKGKGNVEDIKELDVEKEGTDDNKIKSKEKLDNKKQIDNKLIGLVLFAVSILYFVLVFNYLSSDGEGAMINRYSNFVAEGDSAFSIIKSVINNPAYFLSQIFDVDKIQTFMWIFIPVLFVPFTSKKVPTYILLIPCLVLTFMTNNPYQSTIFYQYTYGSAALILYNVICNLSDRDAIVKENTIAEKFHIKQQAVLMFIASVIMFVGLVSSKNFYFTEYKLQRDKYVQIDEILDTVPKDASVTATTFYLTHMTDRKELYKYIENDNDIDTDYIVYDLRYNTTREIYDRSAEEMLEKGYIEIYNDESFLKILRRQE